MRFRSYRRPLKRHEHVTGVTFAGRGDPVPEPASAFRSRIAIHRWGQTWTMSAETAYIGPCAGKTAAASRRQPPLGAGTSYKNEQPK